MRMGFNLYLPVFLSVLIVLLLHKSSALYEDQIGKFDWKRKFIGEISDAKFDSKSSGRKLIVTSKQNVLALIDPRDGSILWRQIYEEGTLGNIDVLYQYEDIMTISGNGKNARIWDTNTGALITEHALNFPQLAVKTNIFGLSKEQSIFRVDFHSNSHFIINTFDMKQTEVSPVKSVGAPWLNSQTSCIVTYAGSLVCFDSRSAHICNLYNQSPSFLSHQVFTEDRSLQIDSLVESSDDVLILKYVGGSTVVFKLDSTGITTLKTINSNVMCSCITVAKGDTMLYTLTENAQKEVEIQVDNLSKGLLVSELSNKINLNENSGRATMIRVQLFLRKDSSIGHRLLLTFEDESVKMFNHQGMEIWNREESLSRILSAEMLELPVSDVQARFEQEFNSENSNSFALFIKRTQSQFLQFSSYINYLIERVMTSSSPADFASNLASRQEQLPLVRDEFNLHKIIVVATASSKVFGIDNLSGSILWKKYMDILSPFKDSTSESRLPLFVQRTTAHFLRKPRCVIIGNHKTIEDKSVAYVFDPITGRPIKEETEIVEFPFKITQASLFHFHDDDFIKPIVLLHSHSTGSSSYQVEVFPKSCLDTVKNHVDSHYIFAADAAEGQVAGYKLALSDQATLIANNVWKIFLATDSQKIVKTVAKRSIEKVHSQGRVMGDRSVLFKYLNPNLVVIVTEGSDSNSKPYFYIYLVDGVNGQMIHSTIHRRCNGPVHVVHSENWVVYSYLNEKSRRTEMAVLEMYEGKTQSNTTVFSSLSPQILPIIEKQAFILPLTGVSAMVDTITEKGMTNKHILVAMPNGGIVEIPKFFVDPRRPIVMTSQIREEGLMPYIPELPIPSEHIINYNQSVARVKAIYTASAGLESTSLVFAYGLDIYFTRVTPSKTFDVLKDDFDHYFISLVLLALIVASYATKQLAAHKALKQAWK